jgi:hypothetical protein
MVRHLALVVSAWIVLLLIPAPLASAQQASTEASPSPATLAGWIVTPSVVYSTSWDDNVLIRGRGDTPVGDQVNTLNPRATLDFNGRRGHVDATYDGSFVLYRQFDTLDSYDQHLAVSARRLVSRHVSLFATNTTAIVPTTAAVEFIGVPFVRTGSSLEDLRGGIEAALTKRTSMKAAYNFQWVHFDNSPAFATLLRGGHSHGISVLVTHALTARTSLTADYDRQHATIIGGEGMFDVQNAAASIEHRLTPALRVFGGGGFAHTGVSSFGPARIGPVWRAGLTYELAPAAIDVSYHRSYVPSYGFGGTQQNQDFTTRLRLPVARRVFVQSWLTWRSNEPLAIGELNLHTLWYGGTVGYALRPWMRLEGFYDSSHQEIARAGGHIDRNRLGFQVVAANPLRIR